MGQPHPCANAPVVTCSETRPSACFTVMGGREIRTKITRVGLPPIGHLPKSLVFTRPSLRDCIRENFRDSASVTDHDQQHNLAFRYAVQ